MRSGSGADKLTLARYNTQSMRPTLPASAAVQVSAAVSAAPASRKKRSNSGSLAVAYGGGIPRRHGTDVIDRYLRRQTMRSGSGADKLTLAR